MIPRTRLGAGSSLSWRQWNSRSPRSSVCATGAQLGVSTRTFCSRSRLGSRDETNTRFWRQWRNEIKPSEELGIGQAEKFHRSTCTRSRIQAHIRSRTAPATILESRFPRKTAIALALLGLAIYLIPEVDFELTLPERLRDVFALNSASLPWHDFKTQQELAAVLALNRVQYNADALALLDSHFEMLVNGWSMTEDEAREAGIPLTHGCRFMSNAPCEDYFALGTAPGIGGRQWGFWGVYDGHAGPFTADRLQWFLIPSVAKALSGLGIFATPYDVEQCVKRAFVRLDDHLLSEAKSAGDSLPAMSAVAIAALEPALSGSCALLSMYDSSAKKLRVACVGDSRAVLGRWDATAGKYICIPLSEDQTGFNASEASRIAAAHPDEDGILDPKSGRLLGLAVTRAFGDHRWKWPAELIEKMQYKFFGTAPRPKASNPPYLTAEPEVTETDIVSVAQQDSQPSDSSATRSDFMIMASDGLWDRVSSENAVLLVEHWLAARAQGTLNTSPDSYVPTPPFPTSPPETPIPGLTSSPSARTSPTWTAEPEYFTVQDDNAAVHLARNAMGGSRRELVHGLAQLEAPMRREAVDDMTVMVVFFDELGESPDAANGIEKKKGWSFGWGRG